MELLVGAVAATGVWYAPDFRENREKPEDEQMAVRILPLTGRELKKVQAEMKSSIRPKKAGDVLNAIEERENKVKDEILKSKIAEVRNLKSRTADGTITEIKDSAGFVEVCLSGPAELLGLLSEVFDAIIDQSKLSEGMLPK